MTTQDNLNQANELGCTIAKLTTQPECYLSDENAKVINRLVAALADKAHELLNPPAIKASSPADEIIIGFGDTAQIRGDGTVEITSASIKVTGQLTGSTPTLQDFFEFDMARGVIDFSLRAYRLAGGAVGFYIHPAHTSGDTAQFEVKGNTLTTHILPA